MDAARLSEIRNRAKAALAAEAIETRALGELVGEVQDAVLTEASQVHALDDPRVTDKPPANARAAAQASQKTRKADKRTAIITNSRAHVQFLEKGPADMLDLIEANAALTARVKVLEQHTATFGEIVKERDTLRAQVRASPKA
jgi:hypothetical protein